MSGFKHLFERELRFLHNNLIHYLNDWPEDPDWKPTPASFSFLTLANHLYALPAAYSALFNGLPEPELMKLWGGPWDGRSREDLQSILTRGISDIQKYIGTRSFDDREQLIPWPFGEPLLPQAHLMNLLSHMYHHRGQLHLYLKQLGADVDTGTVFSE